tara:strand:- start:443 stop:550 length:108 start_codon:yes stop_codon:yes gene_type:complete
MEFMSVQELKDHISMYREEINNLIEELRSRGVDYE